MIVSFGATIDKENINRSLTSLSGVEAEEGWLKPLAACPGERWRRCIPTPYTRALVRETLIQLSRTLAFKRHSSDDQMMRRSN